MEIGIVVLATNAYFLLGLRFMRKFKEFYKGDSNVSFYFFSDTDPTPYLPDSGGINVKYYKEKHTDWVEGTNSKFKNILLLENEKIDYLYYFDADTTINKDFTDEWFIGELVGGEHYGNRTFLSHGLGFDRDKRGQSYVPLDSKLPYTYHYGAFFGGKKDRMIAMCKILRQWQLIDKLINYEPPVNDESYINAYFHFNPPTYVVPTEKFAFVISDKGGLGDTRKMHLKISHLVEKALVERNRNWELRNGKLVY